MTQSHSSLVRILGLSLAVPLALVLARSVSAQVSVNEADHRMVTNGPARPGDVRGSIPIAFAQAREPLPLLGGLYTGLVRSSGFSPRVSTDHLIFFSDGTVLNRLPDAGLLNLLVDRERRDFHDFWGRYGMASGSVRIVWEGGRQWQGARIASGALELNGATYFPRSASDGLRLAGTYRPSNLAPGLATITFRSNGRFEDRGVRNVVGLADIQTGRPFVPTHPGADVYAIMRNSIVFRYDDGRQEQLSFYVVEDRPGSPAGIVIHTYSLVLE